MGDQDRTTPFDLALTGDLVLSQGVLRGGTLGVRNGRIGAILGPWERVEARETRAFGGHYILPGLVDTHVHTGSSPAEGIQTASAAAAAGGVTTIIDMPYDAECPVFTAERLQAKGEEAEKAALVDIGLYATMPKHDGLRELDGLLAAGALAFKFSLYETDAARFPRILDGDLFEAFERLAPSSVPIVLHAELQEVIEHRLAEVSDGAIASAHERTRPVVSETAAVAKAMELALWSGARVHIAHATHPHVLSLIDWYFNKGARVSAETCVHYLALTSQDVEHLGPIAKVNPPVRDESARELLWDALLEGHIASISTDHAPWPVEQKRRPMLDAASGIPGLETFLPVMYTEASRRDIPIWTMSKFISENPARLFGLSGTKGCLEVGYDADLVVVDDSQWLFEADKTFTSAKWSPFDGVMLRGRVAETFVRGIPVFQDGGIVAEPGHGRWLRNQEGAADRDPVLTAETSTP
jgi:allantoinase